jgi:hypothetical protein
LSAPKADLPNLCLFLLRLDPPAQINSAAQHHVPFCIAVSVASAFRTSDWDKPNCRPIRDGVIPALKAARTALTCPRVNETVANAACRLSLDDDRFGIGTSLAFACTLGSNLPRRFASSIDTAMSRSSSRSVRVREKAGRLFCFFPYQLGLPAARSSHVGVLQFVARDRYGSLLIGPVPIRKRAAFNVKVKGMIRFIDRVGAKVCNGALHRRLIFVWRAFKTVVERDRSRSRSGYVVALGASTILGSLIVKVDPRPGSLSTVMSPPIIWLALAAQLEVLEGLTPRPWRPAVNTASLQRAKPRYN